MDFVQLFPPELIEKIFYFLSVDDLVSVSRVSVSWYIASNSSRLWRAAIKQSSSRDRFIKLSDLDKFNGISSNYDSDHSFNVEKPPTSRLPPINPWKLTLCQHNFVQGNLRGRRSKLKLARRLMLKLARRPMLKLARHTIALENDMEISHMNVTFSSKSALDGLYLPVFVRKRGEINKIFYLCRLDGVPKFIQLFTTEAEIRSAYIDRHGLMWWEANGNVNYLSFVENFKSFQSRNSGSSLLKPDVHNLCVITPPYFILGLTMDDNHLAVISLDGLSEQMKIWCRKTFKLKITITHEAHIKSYHFYNGHFYLALSRYGVNGYEDYVEIHDVEQDKLISVFVVESLIDFIVFGVKYYAIVSKGLICVREIETNEVMFNITARCDFMIDNGVWMVDDYFLFIDKFNLKVLNLVDWTISDDGLSLKHYNEFDIDELDFVVIDSSLLVIVEEEGRVDVWDWKLGRKLQEIAMPQLVSNSHQFHVNEIRLASVGRRNVDVVGFW